MPSELRNSPTTFQRAVNAVLSSSKWKSALVYLNDIVVSSKSVEDDMSHLRQVLTRLRHSGVALKLKNRFFLAEIIDHLGHVIRPSKVKIINTTVLAVKALKDPGNQKKLRFFLALCNVLRCFVLTFSRVDAPLNKKLRKNE